MDLEAASTKPYADVSPAKGSTMGRAGTKVGVCLL